MWGAGGGVGTSRISTAGTPGLVGIVGLAVDTGGSVYVTDHYGNRVVKLAAG